MIPNRLQWCLFIQKWSLNCFGTFLSGNLPKTVWWLDFWLRKQCCWIGSASAPKPLVSTSRVNSHLIRTLLGFTTRFLTFLSGYETRKCLLEWPAGERPAEAWLPMVRTQWFGTVRTLLTHPKTLQIQTNQPVNFWKLAFVMLFEQRFRDDPMTESWRWEF